jgi:hypothetical protein
VAVAPPAEGASLREIVEAVRAIPYGRPSERSVAGMLREGRGTCSAKHTYLCELLAVRFPATEPRIVHRVYRVDPQAAAAGRRIAIDATFPGGPWDGRSPMQLACGDGADHPAGADPDAEKRRLEAEHCDPAAREPFIAALARSG